MAYLSHAQLRHGAWSSLHADSAHSSRGLYPGPTTGVIAWDKKLCSCTHHLMAVAPVLDAAGQLYTLVQDDRLTALTAAGEERLLPERANLKLDGSPGSLPRHLQLGPDGILIATTGEAVLCLALTGALRWQVTNLPAEDPVLSPDGQNLYVRCRLASRERHELVALGTGTGIEHWRRRFQFDCLSAPAITADGTLYVVARQPGSGLAQLMAIDGRSGEDLWQQKIAPTERFLAPRLFGDELIYVCGDSGLQAFHAGGGPGWSLKIGALLPVAVGGTGQVYCLHGRNEQTIDTLSAYWPDGQRIAECKLGEGARFCSLNPALDAAGAVYAGVQDPAGIAVRQFSADLKPGFQCALPHPRVYRFNLVLGDHHLFLAGCEVDAKTGLPDQFLTAVR